MSVKPAEAAQRLRAVTLAATHPVLNDAPMSSRDVAKQFLYGVHARSVVVLIKLLRDHLGPYKKIIVGLIVLQAVQTSAALTLPTLNAHIIDNGVLKQDQGYIWRVGGDHARLLAHPDRVRHRRRAPRRAGRRWASAATCATACSTR